MPCETLIVPGQLHELGGDCRLAGWVPRFVVREVEAYLQCGLLQHGLVRRRCPRCGHVLVVAFSCKRRGFRPSCLGRRMSDVAARLVDKVFPEVPIRQGVGSPPWCSMLSTRPHGTRSNRWPRGLIPALPGACARNGKAALDRRQSVATDAPLDHPNERSTGATSTSGTPCPSDCCEQ